MVHASEHCVVISSCAIFVSPITMSLHEEKTSPTQPKVPSYVAHAAVPAMQLAAGQLVHVHVAVGSGTSTHALPAQLVTILHNVSHCCALYAKSSVEVMGISPQLSKIWSLHAAVA